MYGLVAEDLLAALLFLMPAGCQHPFHATHPYVRADTEQTVRRQFVLSCLQASMDMAALATANKS